MVPEKEGDNECLHCDNYDPMFGCLSSWNETWRAQFPPCGRGMVIGRSELEKIINKEKENGRYRIFKTLQKYCSRLFQ